MTQVGSVRTTVVVDLGPEEAFEVFTAEMESWYRRGVAVFGSQDPAAGLRLEPHLGGRVLRVNQGATGRSETEIGRITVWEPGRRLSFVDLRETEVDVSFEPVGPSTRVVLEHRCLDLLPQDVCRCPASTGGGASRCGLRTT